MSLSGKGIKTRDYEVGAVRAVRAAYALGNHSLPHTLRSTNDSTVGLALRELTSTTAEEAKAVV